MKFADRVEICFVAPGGEISGLTAGDRKFNVTGKCTSHLIKLTTGSLIQTSWSKLVSIPSRKVSFQSENNRNLPITLKALFGRSSLSLWRNFWQEKGNSLIRKIE